MVTPAILIAEWSLFFAGAAVPVYIVFGLIGLAGLREITRYESHDSLYYRLNPATKLAALFMVAVSSSFAGLYLGLLATVVILVSYSTLLHGSEKFRLGTLFTIAVVWGTVWGSVSDRVFFIVNAESSGVAVNTAFLYGDLARVIASEVAVSGVFLLALVLVMTSTPSSVMRALRRIGIPNPITFSVVVGMRTVPLLLEAINGIVKVQLMRGFGSRGSRPLGPLYVVAAAVFALIPALIYLLRGARNTAISTGTRAFGAYKSRTYLTKPPFGAADVVVLSLAAAFLVTAFFY
ncbi:MAG TPA: energy-coupling factor transporter transmembrane component T [Nitrososphaerales archaeon]|nr:energy-coupling factor transporter transmembrane component T [Nitrososphaerales archaeon]